MKTKNGQRFKVCIGHGNYRIATAEYSISLLKDLCDSKKIPTTIYFRTKDGVYKIDVSKKDGAYLQNQNGAKIQLPLHLIQNVKLKFEVGETFNYGINLKTAPILEIVRVDNQTGSYGIPIPESKLIQDFENFIKKNIAA